MNITMPLDVFMKYITYNKLFHYQPVPRIIAEAAATADPYSTQVYIEHDAKNGGFGTWNLWFTDEWINECKERRRLEALGPAKPYVNPYPSKDPKEILRQQIEKARAQGEQNIVDTLTAALEML